MNTIYYKLVSSLLMMLTMLTTYCSQAQTVTNGSVTGAPRGNNMIPNAAGWSKCSFSPDLCDVTHPSYVTTSAVARIPSPDGGTWVGLASLGECAQTTITGLTVGNSYTLYFCGACFGTGTSIYNGSPSRPIITVVGATAGSQQFTIPMAANTWNNYQMTFTATATSHVLQTSHPSGISPNSYASLDGFSLSAPCGILLPVELFDFSAKLEKDNKVRLDWKTIAERNSDYFAIERSVDAIEFEEIARVKAAGNSNASLFYNFTDAKLPAQSGVFYYRIRSVDEDESSIVSDVQAVSILATISGAINVYPNPVRESLNLDCWSDSEGSTETSYLIYNALGQLVMEAPLLLNYGSNNFILDVGALTAGQYLLEIKAGEIVYRKKFVRE